jgi:hypothetical protein
MPVIVFDRLGYSFYHDRSGRPFLPADRFAVRLVTDVAKIEQATGPELESVVGVARHDLAGFADAVRFQHTFGGTPATRLVAITERILLAAAELREKLGLAGSSVEDTLPFRDKVVMKAHLREHGVRVPEFAPAGRAAGLELLRAHGKLVAKPRLGAGSVDIEIIGDATALEDFCRRTADQLAEYEFEQFVAGELYHVDSVVDRGRVVAATAGHSIDATTAYRDHRPYRDVAVPSGDLLDALLAFNAEVIACYPGHSGATHHEVFVTAGGICFCEIGARAGGGGTIAGFLSRTGVNLDEACVAAQTRRTVPAPITVAEHLTGYVMVYAGPGRLARPLRPVDEPWVIETQILAEPGAALGTPGGWDDAVAIVSVRGDSEAEVRRRLELVLDRMTPVLE